MEYQEFLKSKVAIDTPTGLRGNISTNKKLFDFQRDIVKWALKRGRAAIFADCGLGKSFMQIDWASHVPGNVLIIAPLAVAQQTVREGKKLGVDINYSRSQADVKNGITITNYEMLEHFDPSFFSGVVLDESSIIKAYNGKTRNIIIESFAKTPFRLACTATPAPNDYMELGNHSEFLGVMSRTEMLSMFFVHDGGDTSQWRLKGHAESEYWKWLCSWAVMIRNPSDLGYDGTGFILPELRMYEHIIKTGKTLPGELFTIEAATLQERQQAKRDSLSERVSRCAELVNGSDDVWVVWCNLNSESEELRKAIRGSVEVKGADSLESKESAMIGFSEGRIKCLITKPSIAGFGLNWQHCSKMAFVGLSDSYEQFYQAVRRCWRFGQKKPVTVHIITADTEGATLKNIKRKEADSLRMAANMVEHMHVINQQNIKGIKRQKTGYTPTLRMEIPSWM